MSKELKYCARESSIPHGSTGIDTIWGLAINGHQAKWNNYLNIPWGFSFIPPEGYDKMTKLDYYMNQWRNGICDQKQYFTLSSFMNDHDDEFTQKEISDQREKENDDYWQHREQEIIDREEDKQWLEQREDEEWYDTTGRFHDEDQKWWEESGKYIYTSNDPEWYQRGGCSTVATNDSNQTNLEIDTVYCDDSDLDLSDYNEY